MPRSVGACLPGDFEPVRSFRGLRHDVYHTEHGTSSVQRGSGPADDLDTIHDIEIQGERRPYRSRSEGIVVQRVPVEEQQDPVVVVGRSAESARAQIGIVAIVTHVKPGHVAEYVFQRPISVPYYVFVRNDRN